MSDHSQKQADEFTVDYGFTRDCETIDAFALQFRGAVKVIPKAIGIYRTGDAYGPLLTVARAIVTLTTHGKWGYPGADDFAPRPADVATDTDGIPEHVIDTQRVTLLHDPEQRLIILQVPGTTHFVIRPRSGGFLSFDVAENELLAALVRATGAEIVQVSCKRNYFALWPVYALVAVLLAFIGSILYLLLT